MRTLWTARISPEAFLSLWVCFRTYQKRDLAATSLGVKTRIRNTDGFGSVSVGFLRPTTWYSFKNADCTTTAHAHQRATIVSNYRRL